MTRKATPNFDRVAGMYRWAEYIALGTMLERARAHFIPRLAARQQALVLGDGDGRFLAQLLAAAPALHALAVDVSPRMLARLRQHCAAATHTARQRLRTQIVSAVDVTPEAATDLVVTHFFLDCFTDAELAALMPRLAQPLLPGTLWLVSEFGIPRNPVAALAARAYTRCLYAAFRVLTGLRTTRLPDISAALGAAGLSRVARREWLGGFLYTELWQVD